MTTEDIALLQRLLCDEHSVLYAQRKLIERIKFSNRVLTAAVRQVIEVAPIRSSGVPYCSNCERDLREPIIEGVFYCDYCGQCLMHAEV